MVAKMELASAYVTLNVSTKAMGQQIGRMFSAAEGQASTSGKRMGRSIQKGMDSASSSSLGDLQKRLTDGEARLTQAVEQGSKRRSAAQRQVKIAEAELQEAKAKGEAQSSRVLAAEDRLIRAREQYSAVSKQAVADIRTHSDAVKQAQSAVDGMAGASGRAGSAIRSAFSGIGQKIGASFQGAQAVAGSVFTGLRSAASVAASGISSVFSGVGSLLKNVFTGNFSGAFNQIVTGAKTAGSAVSTAFSNVWGGFRNGLANARSSIASTAGGMVSSFSGAAARTGEVVRGGLSRGFTGIKTVASRSAAENFAAFTSGAGSAASTIGSKISGGFRSTVSAAANAAKGGASALANGFSNVGSKIGSFLSRGFSGIPSLASKTGNQAGQAMTSNLMSHLGRIPAMVGSIVGVAGIGGILSAGFKRMNDIDHANIIFKNIGLSSKDAKTQMSKLNDQVTGTSTSLSTAAKVSGLLAQSGVKMGDGMDTSIKALTNLSAASGASADDIGMVMLQMKSSGHLYTQDLLQMTQRGINAFGMLADSMGISQEEVRQQVSDGKLTYEDFVKAVNQGTGELAKEMGTTLPAKLTILKTAFANLGMQAIEPFKKQIGQALDAVTQFLKTTLTPKIQEFAKWVTGNSEAAENFRQTLLFVTIAVGGLVASFGALWGAMKLIKAMQGVFAFFSSPLLVLVAAVGLAVAAVVVAYKKFQWFRDLIDNVFWRIKLGIGLFKDAWSNADKHVSASGIPGFFQGLGKLARTVFDTIGDLAKRVVDVLKDYFGPALEEMGKAFKRGAFKDAGKVLGGIAEGVKKVGKFLGDTADLWVPFAVGIGLVTAAFVAYNIAAGIAAGLSTIIAGAIAAISWPVVLTIAAIGLLVGAFILIYKKVEWFRDAVNAVWDFMKDPAKNTVDWFLDVLVPWFGKALGAIAGFFVGLWQDHIVPVWDGIKGVIQGFLTWWTETFWPGITNPLDLIGQAFQWFNDGIIQPVWGWIKGVIQGFLDWWTQTFWPGVKGGLDILGGAFTWFRDNVVIPVWNAIGGAISWVWNTVIKPIWGGIKSFIDNILIPGFQNLGSFVSNIWSWISNVISWAWNVIIKPIWDGIKGFIDNVLIPGFQNLGSFINNIWNWIVQIISWAWNNMVKPIWTGIKWFIDNILIPGFQWLGTFINNIWNWIVQIISWAWNVAIKPIWDAIKWFIDNILIPAFNWLASRVKAAWDFIGHIIAVTWNWIRDTVLNPMGDFLQNNVVDFFRKTKDGIENIWNKVEDVAKKPVGFIIDTVIKDGLIGNYNKIAKTLGVGTIDGFNGTKDIKGWATGGYTGKGRKYDEAGVVHKDEYVIRKESTNKIRQEHGLNSLNYLNATGDLEGAYRMSGQDERRKGSEHGIAAGPGSPTYAGLPSFGNPLQYAIARAGALNVKGSVDGSWNLGAAATIWNGMAGVKVGTNQKGDVPTVHARQVGGAPWAGYYDTSGIRLNIGQGWADPGKSRPIVAAHEIGHALGLPHSMGTGGGASIMDYGTMYGLRGPTDKDAKALQSIYPGGSGKGGGDVGNGSGGINPLAWILGHLKDKFKKAFPKASSFVDLSWGMGEKIIKEAIAKFDVFSGDGGGEGGPVPEGSVKDWMTKALKMKNMFSEANLSLGVRRAMQESGGNPRAVNDWDSNAKAGTPSKGLMQTIGPTFMANMEPGHGDIWNPIDNILASINYTMKQYGSLQAGWGRAGGYADGGLVTAPSLFDGGGVLSKGVQFIDHQREKPDYVLTHEQWRAMYTIADNSAAKGRGGDTWNLYGPDADEVSRRVIEKQKRKEALYA